jgi:hypothetical protein
MLWGIALPRSALQKRHAAQRFTARNVSFSGLAPRGLATIPRASGSVDSNSHRRRLSRCIFRRSTCAQTRSFTIRYPCRFARAEIYGRGAIRVRHRRGRGKALTAGSRVRFAPDRIQSVIAGRLLIRSAEFLHATSQSGPSGRLNGQIPLPGCAERLRNAPVHAG